MTDYLINQYNDKIAAALKSKDDAIAAATQLWNRALEDIMGAWQAASASAAIELTAALEHRNKVYVEGPPVIVTPSTKPSTVEVEGREIEPDELVTFTPGNGAWKVSDLEPAGAGERE